MTARVTQAILPGTAFAQRARKKGKAELARRAVTQIAPRVIAECDAYVSSSTAAKRHRHSRRLRGSFTVKVTANESNDAPLLISLHSSSPAADLLNKGTGPHDIPGNPLLAFPGTNAFAGRTVVVPLVHHPGSRKHVGFMERILYRAVGEAYHKSDLIARSRAGRA